MSITALTSRRPISKALEKKAAAIVRHFVETVLLRAIHLIGSMHGGIVHQDSDLDLVVFDMNYDRKSKATQSSPYMQVFDAIKVELLGF